jgi:F-type H+-transporting ATPase subunit alpha
VNSVFSRGSRIAMRNRVSDNLLCGMRIVDACLSVGRGQRQLILGDRYTGKSSVVLGLLLNSSISNVLASIDGFGSMRIFGVFCVINNSLSKTKYVIECLSVVCWSMLLVCTMSSSNVLLGCLLPLLGISFCEIMRNRGYDVVIGYDDLSKHSKAYRQISLIMNSIPSRDAFPADIFNVHSSLLERSSVMSNFFRGSISSLPVIETINSNLSEYISTNVISITDGQIFNSRTMFLSGQLPAIDSGLSVSRIGSNAQCYLAKKECGGIKNDLTNLRNESITEFSVDYYKLLYLNTLFYKDHLLVSKLDIFLILIQLHNLSLV